MLFVCRVVEEERHTTAGVSLTPAFMPKGNNTSHLVTLNTTDSLSCCGLPGTLYGVVNYNIMCSFEDID